jgi:hypothetical protein
MPRGVMLSCKFKLAEKDKNRKKNKSVFLHQKSAQIDAFITFTAQKFLSLLI